MDQMRCQCVAKARTFALREYRLALCLFNDAVTCSSSSDFTKSDTRIVSGIFLRHPLVLR
jgi:hypothetical protein